jgi:hypothetical protein
MSGFAYVVSGGGTAGDEPPQMMKRIEEVRAQQLATVRAAAQPVTAQSK